LASLDVCIIHSGDPVALGEGWGSWRKSDTSAGVLSEPNLEVGEAQSYSGHS
jgi:hypothetical protein